MTEIDALRQERVRFRGGSAAICVSARAPSARVFADGGDRPASRKARSTQLGSSAILWPFVRLRRQRGISASSRRADRSQGNSLFHPDKAELFPCCRELIPCSVAQGIHLANYWIRRCFRCGCSQKTAESAKFPVFFPVIGNSAAQSIRRNLAVGLKHLFRAVALVIRPRGRRMRQRLILAGRASKCARPPRLPRRNCLRSWKWRI